MSRRLVVASGDMRISREPYDALTDDVNDRSKVSFSLTRDGMGRIASSGTLYAVNTAYAFSEVFPSAPPVILGCLRGGRIVIDDYIRIPIGIGYRDCTPFVAVVTPTSILVTTPLDTTYGLAAGDGFVYMATV